MPKIEKGAIPQIAAGVTTATTASKLVDSTQNFLSTVSIGDLVRNTTDTTFAKVTAIDSDTQLSVDTDIFTITEDYVIENGSLPHSFKIDGVSYQRGGYEIVIKEVTDVGISRVGVANLGASSIAAPTDFSNWTDNLDVALGSVADFITYVEQFIYKA